MTATIILIAAGSAGSSIASTTMAQLNVFESYPLCTRVRLVSMAEWRLVSFERLSVRVPSQFRVPNEFFAFDHGGRLWKRGDTEVSIVKLMGMEIERFRPSAHRHCTTTLHGKFALIREFSSERGVRVSALFPELQLALSAQSPRVEDLALLRTIIETATPTKMKVDR